MKLELDIKKKESRPGCWEVVDVGLLLDGDCIAQFDRSYPSYPFIFVEREDAFYLYHSPGSYMKWAVTRILKSNQCIMTKDLGTFTWGELTKKDEDTRSSGLCYAGFKATPDGEHLFISGCTWGGPYYEVCVNIEDSMNPKVVNVYWNYEDDTAIASEFQDANIVELHNDYVLMESEPRDTDVAVFKYSLTEKGDKTPHIVKEYEQYTQQYKWHFKENRWEFISRAELPAETTMEYWNNYDKGQEGEREYMHAAWPLEMSDEEIWEKLQVWQKS